MLEEYCKIGDLTNVISLIESGTDATVDNNKAVTTASASGHLEIVKYLVENGADITDRNNNAVATTSVNGHIEMVKYLVGIGADITDRNNHAVVWSFLTGHLDVSKYLISIGAGMETLHSFMKNIKVKVIQNSYKKFITSVTRPSKYVFLVNKKYKIINHDLVNLM
jgi:ankyrin repeat protein